MSNKRDPPPEGELWKSLFACRWSRSRQCREEWRISPAPVLQLVASDPGGRSLYARTPDNIQYTAFYIFWQKIETKLTSTFILTITNLNKLEAEEERERQSCQNQEKGDVGDKFGADVWTAVTKRQEPTSGHFWKKVKCACCCLSYGYQNGDTDNKNFITSQKMFLYFLYFFLKRLFWIFNIILTFLLCKNTYSYHWI